MSSGPTRPRGPGSPCPPPQELGRGQSLRTRQPPDLPSLRVSPVPDTVSRFQEQGLLPQLPSASSTRLGCTQPLRAGGYQDPDPRAWHEAAAEERHGPRRPRGLWEQELYRFRPKALGHTRGQDVLRACVVAAAPRTLTGGGGSGGEQGDVLGRILLDRRGRQLTLLLAPLVGHEEPNRAALGGGGQSERGNRPRLCPDGRPAQGHAELSSLHPSASK